MMATAVSRIKRRADSILEDLFRALFEEIDIHEIREFPLQGNELLYIKQRGKERTLAVRRALPDAIDLLVVAMEAGSSLPQAMQRVASELNLVHPVLSQELQITMLEMQAGASRAEALRRFTERAPDDRLRSFLTLVIQSDQLGAGLANTLRVFAEELRRSRLIEAEHKAAELPVKIAVPLVFFIFPCLMGIIFTPIVIRFIRVLFQAGA